MRSRIFLRDLRTWSQENVFADLRWEWMIPAVMGFILSAFWAYPGFMNMDSEWQLYQAIHRTYNDWHPVMMTQLWRYLNRLIPGPAGMFIFDLALFWIGLSIFSAHLLKGSKMAVVAPLLILFVFPFDCALATIMKDTTMVAAMVFSCGMLLEAEERGSKTALILALAAIGFSDGVRHNAFPSTLVMSIWWAAVLRDRFMAPDWRRYFRVYKRLIALGLGLFIGLTIAVSLYTRWVIHPEESRPSQQVMIFDLAGLSVDTGVNFVPAFYGRNGHPLTLDELGQSFSFRDNFWLLSGDPRIVRRPQQVHGEGEYKLLRATWLATILLEPRAYIAHRWRYFFWGLLNFRLEQNWPIWMNNEIELRQTPMYNTPYKIWAWRTALSGESVQPRRSDFYSSAEGIPLFKAHQYRLVTIYNNRSGHKVDAMAALWMYLKDKE